MSAVRLSQPPVDSGSLICHAASGVSTTTAPIMTYFSFADMNAMSKLCGEIPRRGSHALFFALRSSLESGTGNLKSRQKCRRGLGLLV